MTYSMSAHWKTAGEVKLLRPIGVKHPRIEDGFLVAVQNNSFSIKSQGLTKDLDDSVLALEILYSPKESFRLQGKVKLESPEVFRFLIDERDHSVFSKFLTKLRKDQHIHLCESFDVESVGRHTGFQELAFVNNSLPELDMSEIDTSVEFMQQKFSLPIFIVGMTGGISKGQAINETLAKIACEFSIPMGVGSQRIAIENPEYESIFTLKDKFPNLFLIGNLGFSDLLTMDNPVAACKRAIEMIQADALAIHVNVLQECLQIEGNMNFKGAFATIEKICKNIDTPIIIKEVGAGISPQIALRLKDVGVFAIDIGGKGGTSWSYIEGLRSKSPDLHDIAVSFRDWGIPTAYNLAAYQKHELSLPLLATGGIRDGQTVAKACALGASMCGIGLPLLRAALESEDKLRSALLVFKRQLMITMMATGSRSLEDLKKSICLGHPYEQEFKDYLSSIRSRNYL